MFSRYSHIQPLSPVPGLNYPHIMSISRPKALNFITGNKNKLAEVRAILGDVVELQSKSLDLVEIQGTSDEIALDKCRRAAIAVSNA